jgi:hypothetical protein
VVHVTDGAHVYVGLVPLELFLGHLFAYTLVELTVVISRLNSCLHTFVS